MSCAHVCVYIRTARMGVYVQGLPCNCPLCGWRAHSVCSFLANPITSRRTGRVRCCTTASKMCGSSSRNQHRVRSTCARWLRRCGTRSTPGSRLLQKLGFLTRHSWATLAFLFRSVREIGVMGGEGGGTWVVNCDEKMEGARKRDGTGSGNRKSRACLYACACRRSLCSSVKLRCVEERNSEGNMCVGEHAR